MKLTFLGGSDSVTGSSYLIECQGRRLLLDCGMHQDHVHSEQLAFNASSIDAVILSHAHIDHSGLLPLLIKQGFKGPIYSHPASIALCTLLLTNSAELQANNAHPLYTLADVTSLLGRFTPLEFNQRLAMGNGVALSLHDAGHIIGSSIVELQLTEDNITKTLVFSGDLGHSGNPLLRRPSKLNSADIVIMESTYGDREHLSWPSTYTQFKSLFNAADAAKDVILLPAFAIGRSQDLLYLFQQHFTEWGLKDFKLYLDSPMAVEACKVYSAFWQQFNQKASAQIHSVGSPFALPNLRLVTSNRDSKALSEHARGAIIIASSGMCQGGRICNHLTNQLDNPHCHLVFTGYQAKGTRGHALLSGETPCKATIHQFSGLSAHADKSHLIDWLSAFSNSPQVILCHGAQLSKQSLADTIRQQLSLEVTIPTDNQVLGY